MRNTESCCWIWCAVRSFSSFLRTLFSFEHVQWDTAGQEEFDRIRPLSYTDTDTCLVCFSLVARRSYDSARDRWVPEIRHYIPDVPFLMVGLKLDLRASGEADHYSGKVEPITTEEGQALSKSLGGSGYYETSARTREGVSEVFAAAIECSYTFKHPSKRSTRKDKDRTAEKDSAASPGNTTPPRNDSGTRKDGSPSSSASASAGVEGEEQRSSSGSPVRRNKHFCRLL
eukprot:TRINITY_DN1474_c1_g1_i1.p1 TRINITY_DN1474_c1_g1~~TRINITY_DN1474_c1_g1_i1.p1  ORF type:complete len:229 (-),score=40.50 TRINITY_DN1474_c1_g1_i1:44-730(-)